MIFAACTIHIQSHLHSVTMAIKLKAVGLLLILIWSNVSALAEQLNQFYN